VCSFLLHIVYSIGFISRFYCVVFFLFFVSVYMCVCVWATLPDLNKMEWNGMQSSGDFMLDACHLLCLVTPLGS